MKTVDVFFLLYDLSSLDEGYVKVGHKLNENFVQGPSLTSLILLFFQLLKK